MKIDDQTYDLSSLYHSIDASPLGSLLFDDEFAQDVLKCDKWKDKQAYLLFLLAIVKLLILSESQSVRKLWIKSRETSIKGDKKHILSVILQTIPHCQLELQLPMMVKMNGEM